jgi:uncharacterized protein (DUF2252 family)
VTVEAAHTTQSAEFRRRREAGRAARGRTPRSAQRDWGDAAARTDPVALLELQETTRVPELLPVRHARMMVSPFSFYRGAALLMAADLATASHSGLTVQLCGDAHLSNFGLFASPERQLVFDINDFDETLPGPFEWDVKRLAASFEIAGRHRAFSYVERRMLVLASVRAYREQMLRAADASVLDAWYDRLDAQQIQSWLLGERDAKRAGSRQLKGWGDIVTHARTKDRLRAFSKLVTDEGGRLRIKADPPLVVPVEDLVTQHQAADDIEDRMHEMLTSYRQTLLTRRHPLAEYTYVHMARKVVGVGSVGTRSWIILLTGKDNSDPLFLQAKEAGASVLESYLGPSEFSHHGERVVRGQRAMQAASDIFLGWQRVRGEGGVERDFYVRQLHDWKGSLDPEAMMHRGAMLYARVCGETLARAHSRTGDRVEIAAYLGKSDTFDEAIADFAESYADQNESDYRAFIAAIDSGRLDAAQ